MDADLGSGGQFVLVNSGQADVYCAVQRRHADFPAGGERWLAQQPAVERDDHSVWHCGAYGECGSGSVGVDGSDGAVGWVG